MPLVKVIPSTARAMHAQDWRALLVQSPDAPDTETALLIMAPHHLDEVRQQLRERGRDHMELRPLGGLLAALATQQPNLLELLGCREALLVGEPQDIGIDFDPSETQAGA